MHLSWETLSLGSCEVALYIPFPLTFILVDRPCLTGELSQMVAHEQGGGGQVTDWHLQAFGEWLACLFLREPERLWGHCVEQREWPQCGFFVLFSKYKCIIGPLALFLVMCARMCFIYCWII